MKEESEILTEALEEGELPFEEDRRPSNLKYDYLKDNDYGTQVPDNLNDFILLSSVSDQDDSDVQIKTDKSTPQHCGINISDFDVTDSIIRKENDDELVFVEDRNPILTGQETQSPKYNINEYLLKLKDPSKSLKRKRLQNSCWNCGKSGHSLIECPIPKDFKEISRNRKEFQDSKTNRPVYKRYHVEDTQRFAHLVPGWLSKDLRSALGLEQRDLPNHVYRMRLLGYPPGWLQEAVIPHSGISMFDGQGKEVSEPDTEAGEVVEEGSLDKYDIRKIIHYPGFNTPPPSDTHDDSHYWKCPPMSQQQSVEAMLERLSGRIVGGYQRKKLSQVTGSPDPNSPPSFNTLDMEYEEVPEGAELPEDDCKFVPPLPDEELPPPPPTDSPGPPVEEPSLTESEEEDLAQGSCSTSVCATPESRVGKVKAMDLGTPVLKSVSPFSRLPSADKFSVNICDVINFENLPDSTGKYDRINGIIRKVRTKMVELSNDL